MPRPSIALFLATAGLLTGAVGCGKAEAPEDTKAPAAQQAAPAAGQSVPYHKSGQGEEGGEGEKGGEGEEGGEGGEGGEG